jgi:hypothetical protein
VDDPTIVVESLQADRRRAAERQVIRARVLDDDRAGRSRPGQETQPPRKWHRHAGWNLDRRPDDGDRRDVRQAVRLEPVRVDGDGVEVRPRNRQSTAEDRIPGILDDDATVRPEPQADNRADPDDRPRQDDDLAGFAVRAACGPEVGGDRGSEEGIAGRIACGKPAARRNRPPLLAKESLEDRADRQPRAAGNTGPARTAAAQVESRDRAEAAARHR